MPEVFIFTIERDQRILKMKTSGMGAYEIARELDMTPTAVYVAIERALADAVRPDLDTELPLAVERIDAAEGKLWEIIQRPHYQHTVTGQLIRDPDGQPKIDSGPVIAALTALHRWEERRAKLMGIDAPARQHISIEMIDAEIRIQEARLETYRKGAIVPAPAPIPPPRLAIETGWNEPEAPG